MAEAPDSKRMTPRFQPFVAPCRVVETSRRFSAYITDLSLRGAQVSCTPDPSPSGTTVVLDVRLGARRLALPGRIQWSKPADSGDGHRFGITFEGIDARGELELRAVLDEFQQKVSELQ